MTTIKCCLAGCTVVSLGGAGRGGTAPEDTLQRVTDDLKLFFSVAEFTINDVERWEW